MTMGPNYSIQFDDKMGRGIFASLPIRTNQIITECELLVFDELDSVLVNQTDLKHYTFVFEGKRDCLVLGDGEIFNHSNTPNVGYKIVDHPHKNRKLMCFYALREIKEGEQLFIDYKADDKNAVIEHYLKSGSLL